MEHADRVRRRRRSRRIPRARSTARISRSASSIAALFAVAGFLAQGRSPRAEAPILWAATAVITPLAILVALYYRIYGFERALPFAALALLAAALFAVATEMLTKREPRPVCPRRRRSSPPARSRRWRWR